MLSAGADGTTGRLGRRQRIGYGVGDFGFNAMYSTATLFLLFYYTDVLGLSPATAGWVFAIALVWDAVFDPFMGYVAGRTRSRWGRFRPYILFGSIPLALSWAAMFVPTGLGGTALFLFATGTHMLFRTLFAVVSMPYLALSAAMTRDSDERASLAGVRMISATTCALLSAVLTLPLAKAFGGGQVGFFLVAVMYAAVAACVLLFTFASTTERKEVEGEALPRPADILRMLRGNAAFWLVSGAMLLTSVGSTFFQKTLPYYFKYALGREDLISPALGLLAGSAALSIPCWGWLLRRTSKRTMWLCGTAIGLTGSCLLLTMATGAGTALAILPLIGAGAGSGFLGIWSMMPDTVEYGEWRSGTRAEGAVFGLVSLIQKASLGLAAAGLGEILQAIGYRANVVQGDATLVSMRFVMIALPMAFTLGAGILIAFYPIDAPRHARLVRAIDWRRRRRSARNPAPIGQPLA